MRKFISINGEIYEVSGNVRNPLRALKEACEEARKAGFTGPMAKVPKKYLKNHRIAFEKVSICPGFWNY